MAVNLQRGALLIPFLVGMMKFGVTVDRVQFSVLFFEKIQGPREMFGHGMKIWCCAAGVGQLVQLHGGCLSLALWNAPGLQIMLSLGQMCSVCCVPLDKLMMD